MKIILVNMLFLMLFFESSAIEVVQSNQKIERFASEQGFYQNTVIDIASDKYGYLWIATPNGLVKYDNYDFTYYYHDNDDTTSIPDNFIKHLSSDDKGNVWISTRQGLCLYVSEEERFVNSDYHVVSESFMKQDAQGRVWIGGGGSNLYIFDYDEDYQIRALDNISLNSTLNGESIVDIEFLSDFEILVATHLSVFILDINDTLEPTLVESSLDFSLGSITKLKKKGNAIWIGTVNGIYQTFVENDKLKLIECFFKDADVSVISLFLDESDNLWVGTIQSGILEYDAIEEVFISSQYNSKNKNGLTSNRINSFYEDDFGIIWVGTAQGGINKIDKRKKNFYNFNHNPYDNRSISSNLITDIAEDTDGTIWLSFFDNTICKTNDIIDLSNINNLKFRRLKKTFEELEDEWVLSLFKDNKGYWWVGTNNGVFLYDEDNNNLKKANIRHLGKEFTGCKVIKQLDNDKILLGGNNVFLLDNVWGDILNGKALNIGEAILPLKPNASVNELMIDSYGKYWFATTRGIVIGRIQDDEWVTNSHLSVNSGYEKLNLEHNNLFSIHQAIDGSVWIGSFGGGLMHVLLDSNGEPSSIEAFHKKDGLPDEVVYGILEDDSGKLWITTDMGICCLDVKTSHFDIYNINDGILSNNFRQSAYHKSKSGLMLIGGVSGLTIFDPKQITKNEIPPSVIISELIINDNTVLAGRKIDDHVIIEKSISETKRIKLNHRHSNISLGLLVQHNAVPQKNKVSYMLEGVNHEWIDFDGGKMTATYANLGAGNYRFLYKGSNGDGVLSEDVGVLEIKVLAPWYRRWWSLTLWGILLITTAYYVFVYVLKIEKLNQQLKFERLDKERENEMHQAKMRFFTNISHDIKTPLSLITGPLEKIAEESLRPEDKKYFSIVQNNIARLQRLINQLTSYRKAETGHLDLKYSKISLGNFIYPLMEAFDDYAQRAHVNFYYKVNLPNRQLVIDIDKIERVILNLFFNAVKYSDENAQIRIDAGIENINGEEVLSFEVADNGIGIPPEKLDIIFDRFYQAVDDRASWGGSGIGLALCKSLVDLMGGKISVNSNLEIKETRFKIMLPLKEDLEETVDNNETLLRHVELDWMADEIAVENETQTESDLPSILVVDDEEDMRVFISESFKKRYKVIQAINGQDALEKLENFIPKLIISDVMMPKIDGFQLCEKIKSDVKTCHIPVVLLTALEQNADEIKGLENGADVYIRKPFSIGHLEVTVRKLIENREKIFNYFSGNSIVKTNQALEISGKERQFLDELTIVIEKNIMSSDFGVEELSKELGMSTSSFYRRLRKLTGQAPSSYLRNFRLQKATELLNENKDLNVTEVMFEIGIESASYFSSSFKKLYKLTPSEYIKQIRG